MDFTQWLQAKGIDPASLSLNARLEAQAQWRESQQANQTPAPAPVPVPQAAAVTPPPAQPQPQAAAPATTFDQQMAAIDAENARQEFVRETARAMAEANVGNTEKCKQIQQAAMAAIADRTTTRDQFKLAMLQLDRYSGPVVLAQRGDGKEVTAEVLEAAICQTHRLPNLEKRFSADTLQQAHSKFRRGLGLKQLIYLAAQKNDNYRGDFMDEEAMCRAAFRPRSHDYGPMATVPSTIDVSGILGNVANKFLAEPFMFTEQAWREISRIRSANNFQQMTTYRLTSSLKFEKVAPGGELRHGTLGELPYTNQVETYGKIIGIDRRDIINDDLGAFTGLATELARGAGDSLNEVFWTEWLDDSTFFPTDKSLDNYDDGATDSVLSLAGLENADSIFASQTKTDGTPLGVMPQILLVPRGLRATAMTLMSATGLVGQGFNAVSVPDGNPWAGMFQVVSSTYLANTALGGSATAWYLLANPSNLAAIEVAFLFGRDTPVVETSEFEFNRLGQSWRAYFDFGVAKQEYRAGVKLKGAA